MEINRKKQSTQRPSLLSADLSRRALNLAILAILYPSFSYANPDGAQIVSGQVSIDTATPGVTTITNSPNAIINWQNFSIAQNEITRFIQQNGQSAVLNRIIGQNPSEILGQLTSNGKVFLINPNGIVFGAGATVDTQGLIASSLNLSDQDFLSGNYHFMAGSSAGNILNEGIIRAGKDGNIILIAPQIKNNGIIKSDGGSITLAAGQELTITNLDDPEIRFQIQAPSDSALNLGKLLTEGGAINVFASTIKHSGEINADSVQVDQQGNIQLVAQQDITMTADSKISANNSQGDAGTIHIDSKTGTTLAQGTIEAQATQTGKGGNIELLGERVGVLDQAKIDASGENGGGQVLIGGDYQGKNADVHNAGMTYVAGNTTVKADAKTHGNGGKIIAWADNTARVHGSVSAKGGSLSGNGGFIETSGHRYLDVEGIRVNASAANGTAGTWLLDPNNIQIIHATSSGSDANISGVTPFAPPSDLANSTISDYTINQALSGYANVTLTTANTGAAGTGDILFDGSYGNIVLSKNSADAFSTTLTFNAFNDIKFLSSSNTTIETYGAGSTGSLVTVFNPSNGKVIVDTGATLNLNGQGTTIEAQLAGGKVWENNGTINMSGSSVIRPYLSTASTFDNQASGILNINSTSTWSFLSTNASQDGIFNNSGTINVNSNTSWEAMFKQTAGGVLNLHDGLSLQHLDVAAGTINIDSGKTLWVSENHAGFNKFDGAYINGPGRLQVGNAVSSYTPTVTFNNVSTNALTVLREQQGTLAFSGANTFTDTKFFANGTTNIDWAVPAATYLGNTEWWAKGNIALNNNLSTYGNLTLGAGWNADLAAPLSTSTGMITNNAGVSADNVFFKAGKMALSGGTINGTSSVNLLSNNAIDLGTVATDLSNTLELSSVELNTVTAPVLRIGDISSGAIDIKSPLSLLNFYTTLSLTSGGSITQQAGATIGVSSLKASGASVTLTEANPVGVISGSASSPGGQFSYTSANPINVTTVDGVNGITTNNGNVSLTATSGDLHIPTQINAGTATVNLKATAGSVFGTGTSPDIIAGNVYISAYNNIWGSGGLHIDAPLISQLSSTTGFIDVQGFSSGTTLGTVSAYNDVQITSLSPLTVNGGITSTIGDIHLSATTLNINSLVNAGSAEVELEADTLTWDRAGYGQVIGNLVSIEPYTDGLSMTIGAACIGGPGTCLSVTELWRVISPTIGLGSDLAGDIFVSGITSGVSTLTDRNAATTRIGLLSNSGITQSATGIDVQDLGIEASGEVILNAANKISNLAATTWGYNLTFNNAQGFNIVQMSGGATPSNNYTLEYNIVGIDTCSSYSCGDLTLSSTGSIIGASAPITAGNLTIKSGGDVHLADLALSYGALDISAAGNIYSRSMNVAQMTRLSSTNGWIDVQNIGGFMLGSAAITPGSTVANAAGNIMITAMSPLTVNGAIASNSGSVGLTASNGDTLSINAPISAPNGITLTGGALSGSYAGSYLQYFNNGTGSPTSPTNSGSTSSTTESLNNTVMDSTEQVTAVVLGTTPQPGQLLTAEPDEFNSTGGSTDSATGKGKNSKQCTK